MATAVKCIMASPGQYYEQQKAKMVEGRRHISYE